jgi:DNA-binding response OmpR family regulator
LKTEGYEVIQAYNAMEAMVLARKYHPFAITLDIVMPGKDGWDILDELKEDPQTEGIPVICISKSDNRELGLALGVFEYLVKPIEKDQLINELRRLEKIGD